MNILYAASEALPFAASGGLADVAGSLPKALVAAGHNARVVMPLYVNSLKPQHKEKMQFITNFTVPVGWRNQYCGVFSQEVNGVVYYFIDNEYYFKRDHGLYGYYDDAERFVFFSRAVLEMLRHIDFHPQIINSNDWQCALIPVYHHLFYKNEWGFGDIKNVFTIHNIGYQGQYGLDLVKDIVGIPPQNVSILEYDRDINFMKGAIEIADKVTTVSPTYAKEILDPWFSHGLDRILRNKQYKTCGFLNGIDTDLYNPETDTTIAAKFSAKNLKGKAACKSAIFEEFGMPQYDIPLIAMISRFADHKGFDLVRYVFDEIVSAADMQVVILGSGEKQYEDFFQEMHWRYPDKVGFYRGYNPQLAKRIYAGADMFLMPSKSEPCGLAQMIAARYGTVPIVRATGGLKDSIIDAGDNGIGFTFQSYNAGDMLNSIKRARELYRNKAEWKKLVTRAMNADFSWGASAKLYIGLYKELTGEQ